jgi:hypothetical protein
VGCPLRPDLVNTSCSVNCASDAVLACGRAVHLTRELAYPPLYPYPSCPPTSISIRLSLEIRASLGLSIKVRDPAFCIVNFSIAGSCSSTLSAPIARIPPDRIRGTWGTQSAALSSLEVAPICPANSTASSGILDQTVAGLRSWSFRRGRGGSIDTASEDRYWRQSHSYCARLVAGSGAV